MFLAPALQPVETADIQRFFGDFKGAGVTRGGFGGDVVQSDAADARRRAGEVFVDQLFAQTDGLEHLGTPETAHGRNADAAETFQQPFFQRGHIGADGLFGRLVLFQRRRFRHDAHGLQRRDGADRVRAESDQLGEMDDFARFTRFDDDARFVPQPFSDQGVMQSRHRQQRRNRRVFRVKSQIAEDQDVRPVRDRFFGIGDQPVQSVFQSFSALFDIENGGQADGFHVVVGDMFQMCQRIGVQQRRTELQPSEMPRRFRQQVVFASQKTHQRHDQLFAQRVDRRVRDLRELLFEIVEQQLRTVRQHGQRRVEPH